MSFVTKLKFRLYPFLQMVLSTLMSNCAKARMRVITDSGTKIGIRRELFENVIPKGGAGIELGVYKGTLSQYIVDANQPRVIHLVDPWWKYESNWHWAVGDTSSVRSFASLVLVLQDAIAAGQVELHIGGSKEVLEGFVDQSLDWAYVDSTHAYDQTKDELRLLRHKVRADGIIAGDDWQERESHPHHGVFRAVNEFLATEPEFQLIFQKGTQWAIARQVDRATTIT